MKPKGQVATAGGMVDYETPRALELAEIAGVVREYAHATHCALEAGFDGRESGERRNQRLARSHITLHKAQHR